MTGSSASTQSPTWASVRTQTPTTSASVPTSAMLEASAARPENDSIARRDVSTPATAPTPATRAASRPPIAPSPMNPIFNSAASRFQFSPGCSRRVRYLIDSQALVAFRTDPPLAVLAFAVRLVVVAVSLDARGLTRLEHIVEHRPDPFRLGRTEGRDLGHLAVVGREGVGQVFRHVLQVLR